MKILKIRILTAAFTVALVWAATAVAQHHSVRTPEKHKEKPSQRSTLHPAESATVKIITPREGQVFESDSVPLKFTIEKGKRGEHVHALWTANW